MPVRCAAASRRNPSSTCGKGFFTVPAAAARWGTGCPCLWIRGRWPSHHVAYGDPKRLFSFQLEEKSLSAFADVAEAYLLTQLERGFSTLDFYKSLRLS